MLGSTRYALRTSAVARNLLTRRTLLSASFSANDAWEDRHRDIAKLGLGGDYEWISAVQKKFIGGGVASAIDVEAAVCVAEQKDQVDDVVELIYKLRHSSSAADLPPSAEYALLRLLLKHDPERIFTLVDDPINYGVFMNEHSACLAIDHFLNKKDFQGAARLAAWVMQQEMSENELLNLLCLYAAAKWAELPLEDQTMPLRVEEEEEDNEDEQKTFKFPYLKNEWFDDHFDLSNPSHLTGKTLLWVGRDSRTLDTVTRDSVRLLGAVLCDRFQLAANLASGRFLPGVASLVKCRIESQVKAQGEDAVPTENQQKILDAVSSASSEGGSPLSEALLSILEGVQKEEEEGLVKIQMEEYKEWSKRRRELVDAQAERVLLKVKMEELEAELSSLAANEEKLSFFENRLQWEKRAAQNDEIVVPEEKREAVV